MKRVFFTIAFFFLFSFPAIDGRLFAQEGAPPAAEVPAQQEVPPQQEAPPQIEAPSSEPSATKATEQLDFANGLFQRELYEMAIDEYNKIIGAFPGQSESEEATFGIAESLFFMKSYSESMDAYARFIAQYPDSRKTPIAALRSAQALFFTDKHKEAAAKFDSINENSLDGEFLQALYHYKGKVYKALGDTVRSLEYMEKAAASAKDSTQTVQIYHELAQMHKEKGDTKSAAGYYEKAYQSAGDEQLKSVSLYNKGEALFQASEFDQAAQAFGAILTDYPEQNITGDALANLILSFYNLKKYQEAIDIFNQHSQKIPQAGKYFNAYYIVAVSYAQLEKYKESLNSLDKALSLAELTEEDKNKAVLKKSEVMAKSNDFQKAVGLIDDLLNNAQNKQDQALFVKAEAIYGLGKYDDAYNLYKQVAENFKDSSVFDSALFGMAHALNAAGKDKEAMEAFWNYFNQGKNDEYKQEALYNEIILAKKLDLVDRAIERGEKFLAVYKDQDTQRLKNVMFSLGTLYPKTQNYEKAIDIFKQYAQKYTQSEQLNEAYFLIGYNLQLAGKLDEALEYYDKISPQGQEDKIHYSAMKNKGLIYINKGEDAKAAQVFEQIIERADNDLDINTYLWLAKQLQAQLQHDKVLGVLEKAVKKDSGGGFKDAIAYFKGEALRVKQDFKEAANQYNVVIDLSPPSVYKAAARIGKGLSLVELKKEDQAREEFDAALVENPEDHTITLRSRYAIAELEQKRGNLEEASKFYMLVAVLYDDAEYCPQALFNAAEILVTLKKPKEAQKLLKELIETYPKSGLIDKAKERVAALNVAS